MNAKITQIIKQLKSEQNVSYLKKAFRYFVDNQIDANELKEILKYDDLQLPEYFYSLHKFSQKKFLKTEIVYVQIINNGPIYNVKTIFNNYYFYYLVNKAKRNKEYTTMLINYLNNLEDINIKFFALKFINLKFTSLVQYSDVMTYSSQNHISNFYELLFDVYSKPQNDKFKTTLKDFLKSGRFVYFDLDDKFTIYTLLIECLFYLLPSNIRDKAKLKFLILDKEYFENSYIDKIDLDINVLKDYGNDFKANVLKQVESFISSNEEFMRNMKPNGYLAFYSALVEGQYD